MIVVAASIACGAPAVSATPRVEPLAASDVAPAEAPARPAEEAPDLASLLASLEPRERAREPLPAMGSALASCSGAEEEDCWVRSAAAFDPRSGHWVILSVDYSEGGPESVSLALVSATERRSVAGTGVGAAGIEALRRALQPYRELTPPDDLIREIAPAEFSMNRYAPLVLLGAPLEGWVLSIETTGLDSAEHVLHLSRRDGSERHVLGRRPAERGACDGAGWYCEEVPEEECSAEQLRAEGRLCVQPLGIDYVGISPDGASLVVLGTEQVAGHGGYPPFAWVVAMPRAP